MWCVWSQGDTNEPTSKAQEKKALKTSLIVIREAHNLEKLRKRSGNMKQIRNNLVYPDLGSALSIRQTHSTSLDRTVSQYSWARKPYIIFKKNVFVKVFFCSNKLVLIGTSVDYFLIIGDNNWESRPVKPFYLESPRRSLLSATSSSRTSPTSSFSSSSTSILIYLRAQCHKHTVYSKFIPVLVPWQNG